MTKTNAYEAIVAFSSEKRSKAYKLYVDASIAGEKTAIVHKCLSSVWHVQTAGRNGA